MEERFSAPQRRMGRRRKCFRIKPFSGNAKTVRVAPRAIFFEFQAKWTRLSSAAISSFSERRISGRACCEKVGCALVSASSSASKKVQKKFVREQKNALREGARKEAVTVPIDLVPPEMEHIHLEMLKEGKFYAITFRKPPAAGPSAFGKKMSDSVVAG